MGYYGIIPAIFESKEVGKQSSELRMTLMQVTLHHMTIHHTKQYIWYGLGFSFMSFSTLLYIIWFSWEGEIHVISFYELLLSCQGLGLYGLVGLVPEIVAARAAAMRLSNSTKAAKAKV
jgi:hypothetical protein